MSECPTCHVSGDELVDRALRGKPNPCPDLYHLPTDVVKWADQAQFHAEPHEGDVDAGVQPKVHLLYMNADPLGSMAAMNEMYKGNVIRSLDEVDDEMRRRVLSDMQATTLVAPMEAVDLHFLFEGVDRAFTHQDVRQRTAVFAQESLRFAVPGKLSEVTTLPPFLAGTQHDRIRQPGPPMPNVVTQMMRDQWDRAIDVIDEVYHYLVDNGMPAEEARGLLPHCTATRIHHKSNLRNMVDHAGYRLCTQAQFHWRQVWAQIIDQIRHYPQNHHGLVQPFDQWQFEAIADAKWFRPICYQTGKCEFKGSADRACTIRSRVDAFEADGLPSDQWDSVGDDEPWKPINPAEWLLNPAAARVVENG